VNAWIAVIGAGLACYLIRLLPVAVLSSRTPSPWLERVGTLAAPVAFAALVGTSIAASAAEGAAELLPRVVALMVAGVVAHRTRSTAWTLVSGMAVLWLGTAVAAVPGLN
jgi:branched-subunit amino acid transport protein